MLLSMVLQEECCMSTADGGGPEVEERWSRHKYHPVSESAHNRS